VFGDRTSSLPGDLLRSSDNGFGWSCRLLRPAAAADDATSRSSKYVIDDVGLVLHNRCDWFHQPQYDWSAWAFENVFFHLFPKSYFLLG